MKRIVIVGNGLVDEDAAGAVGSADLVVRLNSCRNMPRSGLKTDILSLTCQAEPPSSVLPSEVWCVHQRVLGPKHPLRRIPDIIIRELRVSDADVSSYDPKSGLWPLEGICRGRLPSSGMWVLRRIMGLYPVIAERDILLIGFTWRGWPGHDWNSEQEHCDDLEALGIIRIARTEPQRFWTEGLSRSFDPPPSLPKRKRIVLVGNGRIEPNSSVEIEGADLTIRFNQCESMFRTGATTDILVLGNGFEPPIIVHPRELWLLNGRTLARNHPIREGLEIAIREFRLSGQEIRECIPESGLWPLRSICRGGQPSSGIWALRVILGMYRTVPDRDIVLLGFPWREGRRENLDAESEHCRELANRGFIRVR